MGKSQRIKTMETPVNLEIQGLRASAHLRELIDRNLEKLERIYGRVTACHVAIRAPNLHHRKGEGYFVSIRLSLPDRKNVIVNPPPRGLDRRQGDVTFAVNDAFKRAERQLDHRVSRLRTRLPAHEGPPEGKVLRIDRTEGFGFLESEDGREIYFHANSVIGGKFAQLKPGIGVTFHEELGEKGPQASSVHLRVRA